jgi:hypothetical protein
MYYLIMSEGKHNEAEADEILDQYREKAVCALGQGAAGGLATNVAPA